MTDQAPRSSRFVQHHLVRHTTLPGSRLDAMEVSTKVTSRDTAETTITRLGVFGPAAQNDLDSQIEKAITRLPGYAGSHSLTMGRYWTVEWDGVRAPV